MEKIRKSIVAGSFYPQNPAILETEIREFLAQANVPQKYNNCLGIISPHAGYFYSGQCAAYGFNAIKQKKFRRAVIIAPSHRFAGFKFSLGNYDFYQTPLGMLKVDKEFVNELLKYEEFVFFEEAHYSEHSLEVQLPFLQIINPDATIVPIIFGNQNAENAVILANILKNAFAERLDETVFIISSDLSHYYDDETARKMDMRLVHYVKEQMIEELERDLQIRLVEACGFAGILVLLHLAKEFHFEKVDTLHYSNSGDVNGDYSQVVGYLSSVIYSGGKE